VDCDAKAVSAQFAERNRGDAVRLVLRVKKFAAAPDARCYRNALAARLARRGIPATNLSTEKT